MIWLLLHGLLAETMPKILRTMCVYLQRQYIFLLFSKSFPEVNIAARPPTTAERPSDLVLH